MAATPPFVSKARLYSLLDDSISVNVHFNPTSLVYSVENSTPQQSGDLKARQYAGQFTGKLTMDLQFDTTDYGDDVRLYTGQVAYFLQPSGASQFAAKAAAKKNSSDPPKAQPVVCFEWGAYRFQGVMESFRETIDFFSDEGVPLRALVSIALARQDQVFDDDAGSDASNVDGSLADSKASVVPTSSNSSPQKMATLGGDPTAARQLALTNGLASTRFTAGASLQVGAGVQLKPAAGFAVSASAGGGLGLSLGASAGAGASIGGGFLAGAGVSGGAGFSASAGVSTSTGGPLFGSSASAGVPATLGAFAGLETGRAQVSTTAQLDPMRMLRATSGASVATLPGASFSLGGAANNISGAGLSADVGANFSFSSRLTFDSDD